MRISLPLLSTAVGLGLTAAVLGTGPAATAAAPQELVRAAQLGYQPSAGSGEDAAANRAFFEAVVKSVAEKRAANPSAAAAVTVYYSATNAPSFRSQISRSAQIWNSSVSNVRLAESSSGADFAYYEGNDSRRTPGRRSSPPTWPWTGTGPDAARTGSGNAWPHC
ncbi:snapalysin family zinc-dependent metalloprotease, partial [Streptomyces tendae]